MGDFFRLKKILHKIIKNKTKELNVIFYNTKMISIEKVNFSVCHMLYT